MIKLLLYYIMMRKCQVLLKHPVKTLALCHGEAGTKARLLYTMEQADAEKGGGEHVSRFWTAPARTAARRRAVALRGTVRAGAGAGHFCRGRFSGGGADVSGRVSSHLLRHRLFAQILGGMDMKIVVWKSPKMLSALLRRVFGVKEEA